MAMVTRKDVGTWRNAARKLRGTGQRRGHNPFVLVNHSPTICLNPPSRLSLGGTPAGWAQRRDAMDGPNQSKPEPPGPRGVNATRRSALGLLLGAPLLSACAGVQQSLSQFSNPFSSSDQAAPAGPAPQPVAGGNGQVKVGLILPL